MRSVGSYVKCWPRGVYHTLALTRLYVHTLFSDLRRRLTFYVRTAGTFPRSTLFDEPFGAKGNGAGRSIDTCPCAVALVYKQHSRSSSHVLLLFLTSTAHNARLIVLGRGDYGRPMPAGNHAVTFFIFYFTILVVKIFTLDIAIPLAFAIGAELRLVYDSFAATLVSASLLFLNDNNPLITRVLLHQTNTQALPLLRDRLNRPVIHFFLFGFAQNLVTL